ncbi:hypothetical protein C0J52_14945 [Blattella germanica]|nr:hypothetical protein C0J52_14945 [Blattella germanica]
MTVDWDTLMASAIFRVLVNGFCSKSTVGRVCLTPQLVLFGINVFSHRLLYSHKNGM